MSVTLAERSTPYIRPDNPAEIEPYPPTLPLEVALKTAPVKDICEAYGLTRTDWDALKTNPTFVHEVATWRENLKKDGGLSFRMKARLQAEELLKTSWRMIHDRTGDVAPSVQADLIKFTIRAAGLDGSKDQAAAAQQNALQININLG
jgi:hypothetical protein